MPTEADLLRYVQPSFETAEEAARRHEATRQVPHTTDNPTMGHAFYSILFSLDTAKTNLYIECLQLQLRALLRTKMLRDSDRYMLVCDKESAEEVLKTVSLPKQFKMIVAPKPKSLYEGMRLKYLFPFFVQPPLHPNEVAVYMDLDILPRKNGNFFAVPRDTICLFPEGDPIRPDYCGDLALQLPVGVTAGFFAYRHGHRVTAFFNELLKILETGRSDFYTLDQPHFNHLLARINFKSFFDPKTISFNGHGHVSEATLVNFAGEPGDGAFHLRKMLRFFLTAFS